MVRQCAAAWNNSGTVMAAARVSLTSEMKVWIAAAPRRGRPVAGWCAASPAQLMPIRSNSRLPLPLGTEPMTARMISIGADVQRKTGGAAGRRRAGCRREAGRKSGTAAPEAACRGRSNVETHHRDQRPRTDSHERCSQPREAGQRTAASAAVKISAAHNSVGSESSISCSQCGTKHLLAEQPCYVKREYGLHSTRKMAGRQRRLAAMQVCGSATGPLDKSLRNVWPK